MTPLYPSIFFFQRFRIQLFFDFCVFFLKKTHSFSDLTRLQRVYDCIDVRLYIYTLGFGFLARRWTRPVHEMENNDCDCDWDLKLELIFLIVLDFDFGLDIGYWILDIGYGLLGHD